jgi:hypothetical protein
VLAQKTQRIELQRIEKALFATCFVEFNGKPVASVKKGFKSAVRPARLPGKVTPVCTENLI